MHVPVHLPLAESVDKERDHEDLQLFEGGKKTQGKGREAFTVHTLLGTIFSLCFDSLLKSSSTSKYTESSFSQDNSGREEE